MRLEEKITESDYNKKYHVVEKELNELRDQREDRYETLQGEESISTRIKGFRKTFDHELKMDQFKHRTWRRWY